MDVQVLQLIEGARRATGLAVVIDVFRAFSLACYLIGNGARRVIPVGELETAYRLKRENPDYVLLGERDFRPPPGFDFGNSPADVEHVDLRGRTVVHTTSAGTQGLANARGADEVITGSFVNAPAIVNYVRARRPPLVSLVCMGRAGVEASDEDTLCANWIERELRGDEPQDFEKIREHLRAYEAARKFFDEEQTWAPARDFDLCLDLGRFDFVLRLERDHADGHNSLRKLAPGADY